MSLSLGSASSAYHLPDAGSASNVITVSLYWDPITTLTRKQRVAFQGQWEDLLWLNVPGPFWTGTTDTCWTGRIAAPDHVLYGGEFQTEFVYRQPRTPTEVSRLAEAARTDPFQGYGLDGDTRWTPDTLRAWWHDRHRISRHLDELQQLWAQRNYPDDREAITGLHDFAAYLAGPLQEHLRIYLYWLLEHRSPTPNDRLPDL
jgi:hypothetical protein